MSTHRNYARATPLIRWLFSKLNWLGEIPGEQPDGRPPIGPQIANSYAPEPPALASRFGINGVDVIPRLPAPDQAGLVGSRRAAIAFQADGDTP